MTGARRWLQCRAALDVIVLAPGASPQALAEIRDFGGSLPDFVACSHEEFRDTLFRIAVDAVYLNFAADRTQCAVTSLLAALGGPEDQVLVVAVPREHAALRLGLLRTGAVLPIDPEDAVEVASAACRAAIRRRYRAVANTFRYGNLTYDSMTDVIHLGERKLELSAPETRILAHLIKCGGRSASPVDLSFQCFRGVDGVSLGRVGLHVRSLRAVLKGEEVDAPSIWSSDDGSLSLSCASEIKSRRAFATPRQFERDAAKQRA